MKIPRPYSHRPRTQRAPRRRLHEHKQPLRNATRQTPLSMMCALAAGTLLAGVCAYPSSPAPRTTTAAAVHPVPTPDLGPWIKQWLPQRPDEPAPAGEPTPTPTPTIVVPPPAPPTPRARPAAKTVAKPAPAPARLTGVPGARAFARGQLSSSQWECLDVLWEHESNWRHRASNPSSGAYGIPQALPGNKMSSAGSDWRTNPTTQVKWGLHYISERYGSPCRAWNFWKKNRWY